MLGTAFPQRNMTTRCLSLYTRIDPPFGEQTVKRGSTPRLDIILEALIAILVAVIPHPLGRWSATPSLQCVQAISLKCLRELFEQALGLQMSDG